MPNAQAYIAQHKELTADGPACSFLMHHTSAYFIGMFTNCIHIQHIYCAGTFVCCICGMFVINVDKVCVCVLPSSVCMR